MQNIIKERCEEELSIFLNVDVSIGNLEITPFNRIKLNDVSLSKENDTMLKVEEIGAGISIFDLLFDGKIIVNYAELLGMDARVNRKSPTSPLNIQPIIDALSPKDKNKPPTLFDLRVNTLVIRRSAMAYDILSEPYLGTGRFDKNHISIKDFRADIHLPVIKNDDFIVEIKRFAMNEKSGLSLSSLIGDLHITNKYIEWDGLNLALPQSRIVPANGRLYFSSLDGKDNRNPIKLQLLRGTYVFLPDVSPFLPMFADLKYKVNLEIDGTYHPEHFAISNLDITTQSNNWAIELKNADLLRPFSSDNFKFVLPEVSLNVDRSLLALIPELEHNPEISSKLPDKLTLSASANISAFHGEFNINADIDDGSIKIKGGYDRSSLKSPITAFADLITENINLKKTLSNDEFGNLNINANGAVVYDNDIIKANLTAKVEDFEFRGYKYNLIEADLSYDNREFHLNTRINDGTELLTADIEGADIPGRRYINANVSINELDLNKMHLTNALAGYSFTSNIDANLAFDSFSPFEGEVRIQDFIMKDPNGKNLSIDNFMVRCDTPNIIDIQSDFISGVIDGAEDGNISLLTLPLELKDIALASFPIFNNNNSNTIGNHKRGNSFNYAFTIDNIEKLTNYFNMSIKLLGAIDISGRVNAGQNFADLNVDIPFLVFNEKKYIKDIILSAQSEDSTGKLDLSAKMPLRKDLVAFKINAKTSDDNYDIAFNWKDETDTVRIFKGEVDFFGRFFRSPGTNNLATSVNIMSDSVILNNENWNICTAAPLFATKNYISIDGLDISRSGGDEQYVNINGIVSPSIDESLTIKIKDVNLDYIFKTLEINNAQLGGIANGTVNASGLLGNTAVMTTDKSGIRVKNISFNGCVMGDAFVTSFFDTEAKVVEINGEIQQPNNCISKVTGQIYPFNESINIDIKADHAPLGFMNHYVSAFASEVKGVGTGWARVYGTFKDMDLAGKVAFEDLSLKLDFTNTTYYSTDSIAFDPGKIRLDNIRLKDIDGNTAKLNGEITHTFFRDPHFDISINDAKNFLVYNAPMTPNELWYGKIYADGKANVNNNVKGRPNDINISADITTASGSSFTYILSEQEIAEEYTFITYRDKNAVIPVIEVEEYDELTKQRMAYEKAAITPEVTESHYIIDLNVGINPQAEINLIMDPKAGDKIRSHGNGNVRVVYKSEDEDLNIFGEYKLDQGFYNFTLQDIIIKDFKIEEGSTISFPDGNPYETKLNIKAYYELTANLSDLDDSFLQDKELNRTNIRVRAILNVKGSIQDPELSLDLEFPTLTEETIRKIRSIINTDEILNRQIIYLLALNRFYTPDYMSTTKGSELVSLASSTLTSQLSNMLSQLTDVVAISPSLRSDKGDFSDVEFDLALSSALLNNRLLLNGNFGYRDKTLNTNQFIGDFDLEYLLNRQGTFRVKAYNRFNDQNYYLRTAETTQGVGLMFKTDFDDFGSIVRGIFNRKKKKAEESSKEELLENETTGNQEPTNSENSAIPSSDALKPDEVQ